MKNPFLEDGWTSLISFEEHDISERWDAALSCYVCWWRHDHGVDASAWSIEQGYAQSREGFRQQLRALRARLPHTGIMDIAEERDLLDIPLMPRERQDWSQPHRHDIKEFLENI